MNIYVGNLAYSMSEEELEEVFGEYGQVESVKIIKDRDTGRAKGYGFVEMEDQGANAAITALNNAVIKGRNIRVNEARPRNPRV